VLAAAGQPVAVCEVTTLICQVLMSCVVAPRGEVLSSRVYDVEYRVKSGPACAVC